MDLRGRDLAAELNLEFTTARSRDLEVVAAGDLGAEGEGGGGCSLGPSRSRWSPTTLRPDLAPRISGWQRGGGRRPCDGGRRRRRLEHGVRPNPVVPNHLETGSGGKEHVVAKRRQLVTLGSAQRRRRPRDPGGQRRTKEMATRSWQGGRGSRLSEGRGQRPAVNRKVEE
uniref:Uncharacterized protein n=1 Tax=Oryza glaberrima TaxID=4538 RepID=I1QZ90_ORYGL